MFRKRRNSGVVYQLQGQERGKIETLNRIIQAVQREYVDALNMVIARERIASDVTKPIAFDAEQMAFVRRPTPPPTPLTSAGPVTGTGR